MVSYVELEVRSRIVAHSLLAGGPDLAETRVAYLVSPGARWTALQWGIWRAGGIAVPLALSHPRAELVHVLRDSGAAIAVADADTIGRLGPAAEAAGISSLLAEALEAGVEPEPGRVPAQFLPRLGPDRRAMLLYTSGTSGRPKGVVLTHANLAAQITALVTAWEWTDQDRTLLVLPLHHVHGIVNVLGCALWAGAVCEVAPGARFDPRYAWQRLASAELTLFMAVPTIYHRLIAAWDAASPDERRAWSAGARQLRLMVSGSAALPAGVLERWREITGHTLLERYGTTECGMILSHPLRGRRRPGCVGTPLPGVAVRLVDDHGQVAAPGQPGELEVCGPGVFREYWGRPEETRAAFRDGWFRTGDVAVLEAGAYRLLGRTSVDILKTGGHKVSALEIEAVLREHPAVGDCAVVGAADPEWGEVVCVAVELVAGAALSLAELYAWARPRLAPYKLPRRLRCVTALPRNAMGKVVKPEVARWFSP